MATKNYIITLAAVIGALSVTSIPAFAAPHDPCLDGTAPAGWKRPGGYCEISSDRHSALPYGHDGGGGASQRTFTPRFFSSNSGGYSGNGYTLQGHSDGTIDYHSNGDGTSFTFQVNGDGHLSLVH